MVRAIPNLDTPSYSAKPNWALVQIIQYSIDDIRTSLVIDARC